MAQATPSVVYTVYFCVLRKYRHLISANILSHGILFQARVSFSPTLDQQRKCPGCDGTLIDGDFIITYDVKREEDWGDIQVQPQRHF